MMKKTRKLHLWIGLISSVFILIQSVTGLLISEPWLVGGSSRGEMPRTEMNGSISGAAAGNSGTGSSGDTQAPASSSSDSAVSNDNSSTADQGQQGQQFPNGQGFPGGGEQGEGGIVGFAKKLHEGMIYGNSYKIIVDLTAASLIFMTLTGICLSIRVLKGQSKQRRRAKDTPVIHS